VRLAVVGGILAFVAGLMFAVFTVLLQQSERAEKARRTQVVATVAQGEPGIRLAYFAGASERPYVAILPDELVEQVAGRTTVTLAYDPLEPRSVGLAAGAPDELGGRAEATVVDTERRTKVVYGIDRDRPPLVADDPSDRRSAPLVDDQALILWADPDDPADVQVIGSTTARDLTFWFIAIKLMIAGPLLTAFALTRSRRSALRTR
jgi:hypothetical protein